MKKKKPIKHYGIQEACGISQLTQGHHEWKVKVCYANQLETVLVVTRDGEKLSVPGPFPISDALYTYYESIPRKARWGDWRSYEERLEHGFFVAQRTADAANLAEKYGTFIETAERALGIFRMKKCCHE